MFRRVSHTSTHIGLIFLLLLLIAGRAVAEPSLRLEAGATAHHGEDMTSEPGFAFGGSFALTRWAPFEYLALVPQFELLFARRNTSFSLAGANAPLSMDSLELPLLLRGEASLGGRTFYALGGGYAGLLLRAQSLKRDGVVERADTVTTMDIGWVAGVGGELASLAWGTLFVELRYQRSYRALQAASDVNPELFSVLLGYGLDSGLVPSTSSWTRERSLAMKGGFVATRIAGATGSEYGPGVSFGAAFSPARLGSRVALVPLLEALFVHRIIGDQESGGSSLGLDSLESSALIRGELALSDKSVYGVGGAYASVLIRAQRTRDGVTTDIRDTLRSLDFGWVAGAGFEFTAATRTRLALELRYQRSLREAISASLDAEIQNTLFCLMGLTYGGKSNPASGRTLPQSDTETAEAVYSRGSGSDAAKTQSPALRVADGPVVFGRLGDRWLDTMEFQRVERATRDGVYGYQVRYHISGHGIVDLFWPRDAIDFSEQPRASLLASMKLRKGRLRYPRRITRRSLPDVHQAIIEIEKSYTKQADGMTAAMEGFVFVVSLGGLKPTLRPTSPRAPPRATQKSPRRGKRSHSATGSATGNTTRTRVQNPVWEMRPFDRGRAIERAIGSNLPGNFPVIDRFTSGVVTSIKSLDLSAKSYQNMATLKRTIHRYIDSVARFNGRTWAHVRVRGTDITGRVLELVIPAGTGTVAQRAIIQAAVEYGQSVSVVVKIISF